jgi:hypothetical protein
MLKALLLLTALIMPFFSYSNIFISLDIKTPETTEKYLCSTTVGPPSNYESTDKQGCGSTGLASLISADINGDDKGHAISTVDASDNGYVYAEYQDCYQTSASGCYAWSSQTVAVGYFTKMPPEPGCPNQDDPAYTYGLDQDDDGVTDGCARPEDVSLADSCNVNDSPDLQVTEQNACYSKPDGSMCSVTAVDVGGGNQVYMGSEGDCYTDPQPDVSGNPTQGEANPDGTCTNNGGLLACAEDPENVCKEQGSAYGGGSVNNCLSGCGYVNDSFTCYDTDIDDDGLPDYNDPDIDGDGIPNDSDLDNDGDGNDDPINGGAASGGQVTNIDLSPVVSELQKLNKQFDKETPDPFDKDGKLEQLNDDYKTEVEQLAAQSDSELFGVDSTLINNMGKSGLSVVPSGSCSNHSIPVGKYNFTLDTCTLASKLMPIVEWVIYFMTAWYLFGLFNRTLTEGI